MSTEILDIKNNVTFTQRSIDKYITILLIRLEIPARNKGFLFTKECVKIVYNNPSARFNLFENVFKPVAIKYGTSSANIERSIRHALFIASSKKKLEAFEKVFNTTDNFQLCHPSVGEFISLLAETVNMAF